MPRSMPRSMRNLAFRTVLLLSLPFTTWVGPVQAEEAVKLKFGWSGGLNAKVTYLTRSTKKSSLKDAAATTYGTFDVSIKAAEPRGLLVAYDNFDVQVTATGPNAIQQRLMGKLASLQPDFIVDNDGQFVRPVGLERFQVDVRKLIDQMLAGVPPASRRQFKQKTGSRLTRQIQTQLKNQWEMVVGVLIDLELVKGRPVIRKIAQPIDLLDYADIPVTSAVRFIKRSRCGSAPSAQCAEIAIETTIDSKAADRAAKRIARETPKDGFYSTVARKYDMRQRTRVLVEPETLLIHRVHIKKTVTASVVTGEKIEDYVAKTESKMAYKY